MSLTKINNNSPTHVQFCNCATCRSLQNARIDLSAVPVEHMSNSHVEREAANLIIHAERLLGTAQSILQQHHVFEQQRQSLQHSPTKKQYSDASPSRGPLDITVNEPRVTADGIHVPGKENSPAHARQVTNPFKGEGGSSGSPPKEDKDKPIALKDKIRSRAAELGILRTTTTNVLPSPLASPTTPVTLRVPQDHDTREKCKFIVCDHCRSHGIRCNEASVCKECILREVPCTHRQCDISPTSRASCPRTVCFYVHSDWMPDVHGSHNPSDINWLILPGKVREHLSAGQLGKVGTKSDAEVRRCYAGVEQRQKVARDWMRGLVEKGEASWESVGMACRCKEIEGEEEKMKVAEMRLRRMNVEKIEQGSA